MTISRRFAEFLERLRKGVRDTERARLAAILGLNRALANAQDQKALLNLMLDEAIAAFGAERGFVVLTRGEGKEFAVEAARSLDHEPVRNPERKVSATVIRRCLAERVSLFEADAQEGDFAAAQSVADLRLRSVLCTPLLAGERLLGCLVLDHRFQSGAFGQDDLPWVQAFADQAAITLHLHALLEENRGFAAQLAAQNQQLQAQVAEQAQELTALQTGLQRNQLKHEYAEFVGQAPALLRCLHLLDRVVDAEFPVLLLGESGTGKELAARALHHHGRRGQGPFVGVNVAAISPGLLESELFGHRRGAFTGADRDRPGLFREAQGGVLFLDEVTEMDLELQAKLLRALETGYVRPVGGDRDERVELRVIAASNRDPRVEVEAGRFRRDVYYRLAVVQIELPPLRERRSDVPELVRHFLAEAARARGAAAPRRASAALVEAMTRRQWPGNLRQLRNEVMRLDALAGSEEIGPELLGAEDVAPTARTFDLGALERWAIQEALKSSGGNKAEAARLLGISRRALYHKLGDATAE